MNALEKRRSVLNERYVDTRNYPIGHGSCDSYLAATSLSFQSRIVSLSSRVISLQVDLNTGLPDEQMHPREDYIQPHNPLKTTP